VRCDGAWPEGQRRGRGRRFGWWAHPDARARAPGPLPPPAPGFVDPGPANLVALTEGVHSKEAIELVREHLLGVMGPAAGRQFSSELIKMSKFQIAQVGRGWLRGQGARRQGFDPAGASALCVWQLQRLRRSVPQAPPQSPLPPRPRPQVYAASIMFGYFLRRVDRRFQLEKALGSIDSDGAPMGGGTAAGIAEPEPAAGAAPLASGDGGEAGGGAPDDAVARLERLFQQAGDVETASDPDSVEASVYEVGGGDEAAAAAARRAGGRGASSSGGGSGGPDPGAGAVRPRKSALRRYVEGFDQATMIETARVVSAEGAALVERQTSALFGDIKELTKQMQDAVGGGVGSAEELYARIQNAVAQSLIETVTMTVATQRRCVLEAVAFGTFLRDVEGHVQSEYGLLTPMAQGQLPGGSD
jgi:hypothetical protein